jgi:hypothetical protein
MNWISVKDKLPELGESVLLIDAYESQYVGWLHEFTTSSSIHWQYSYCCGCAATSVTHWMPLPEPPK